jgi:hypothetical protein
MKMLSENRRHHKTSARSVFSSSQSFVIRIHAAWHDDAFFCFSGKSGSVNNVSLNIRQSFFFSLPEDPFNNTVVTTERVGLPLKINMSLPRWFFTDHHPLYKFIHPHNVALCIKTGLYKVNVKKGKVISRGCDDTSVCLFVQVCYNNEACNAIRCLFAIPSFCSKYILTSKLKENRPSIAIFIHLTCSINCLSSVEAS